MNGKSRPRLTESLWPPCETSCSLLQIGLVRLNCSERQRRCRWIDRPDGFLFRSPKIIQGAGSVPFARLVLFDVDAVRLGVGILPPVTCTETLAPGWPPAILK